MPRSMEGEKLAKSEGLCKIVDQGSYVNGTAVWAQPFVLLLVEVSEVFSEGVMMFNQESQ